MSYQRELAASIQLVQEAGQLIMDVYREDASSFQVDYKKEKEPVTRADRIANEHIVTGIQNLFPSDSILAEESIDNHARLLNSRVWIVDPLDGTKEFIAQNGEFSVMIGLADHGQPVVGAVFLPAIPKLYYASFESGAYSEEQGQRKKIRCSKVGSLSHARIALSRSHRKPTEELILRELAPAELVISGSTGIKIGLIAENKADLYFSTTSKGIKEWDACAPDAIIREAGGLLSGLDGNRYSYNKENVYCQRGIIATSTRNLLEQALQKIAPFLNDNDERSSV